MEDSYDFFDDFPMDDEPGFRTVAQEKNASVCFCIIRKERLYRSLAAKDVRNREMHKALYRMQEWFEQMSDGNFEQAFVYGDKMVTGRDFCQYEKGYRTTFESNTDSYSVLSALTLSYAMIRERLRYGTAVNVYLVILTNRGMSRHKEAMESMTGKWKQLKEEYPNLKILLWWDEQFTQKGCPGLWGFEDICDDVPW